jgi:thioredoxin 1
MLTKGKIMTKHTKTTGTETWEDDVLHAAQPVLVDFWAPWCAPCRMIAPALEELAEQYAGKVTIAKLNVDDSADVAARYGIQSIPTLLLFREGKVVEQYVGARPKADIARLLEQHAGAERAQAS